MNVSIRVLLRGAIWTLGGFGAGQIIRLGTNIILARILAPQLFGLMLIVSTVRFGIELMSDIGIGQNIIYSPNAYEPDFYNTAWSLQLIRSVGLFLLILVVASPLAQFYDSPILSSLLPVTGIMTLLGGLTSVSPQILQKRLQFGKLNAFQLLITIISSALYILVVYISPTIWAMVFGNILGSAATAIGSYFLLPEIKQRFRITKRFVNEIIQFGKWIALSSIVYFLSMNIDRLYFAKVVPLELLGVYGIARSISELLSLMAVRLGNGVVFPFVASHSNTPRPGLRRDVAPIRGKFLLLAAVGCSLFVAAADLAIRILYDQRYQAAGWMLPILVLGSWFSIMASLNESTLLGLGAPSFMAISNSLKFVLLLFGLPLSFRTFGLVGAVLALPLIEACRYIPIYIGQKRQHFSFGKQDVGITVAMFLMIGLWEWLRWVSGFGTSFDSLPIKELVGAGP
jgi:O-antigen/teichoic acid export membrane protein